MSGQIIHRPQLLVMNLMGSAVTDRREMETCVMLAAQEAGILAPRPRVRALLGYTMRGIIAQLVDDQLGQDHSQREPAILEAAGHLERILENHILVQKMVPREGCVALFEWLRSEQVPVGLCTGLNRHLTRLLLRRLGWDKGMNVHLLGGDQSLVQAVVTADDVPRGRPFPYMIHRLMAQLGVPDVQGVICVGDTMQDLEAGARAGCGLVFGLLGGAQEREMLAMVPHDHLVESPREIPAILRPMLLRNFG